MMEGESQGEGLFSSFFHAFLSVAGGFQERYDSIISLGASWAWRRAALGAMLELRAELKSNEDARQEVQSPRCFRRSEFRGPRGQERACEAAIRRPQGPFLIFKSGGIELQSALETAQRELRQAAGDAAYYKAPFKSLWGSL